jgi:hypothetical protein
MRRFDPRSVRVWDRVSYWFIVLYVLWLWVVL